MLTYAHRTTLHCASFSLIACAAFGCSDFLDDFRYIRYNRRLELARLANLFNILRNGLSGRYWSPGAQIFTAVPL
jgi:hypothetical protein